MISTLEDHFSQNLKLANPLEELIRAQSWKQFCQMGLPDKKMPGFGYFPLSRLYGQEFDRGMVSPTIDQEMIRPFIFPKSRHSHLVFVNGHFLPHLSNICALPKEICVLPLSEAFGKYGHFLQGRISALVKDQTDSFANLNVSLTQGGAFVSIPQGLEVKNPIQCIHVLCTNKPILVHPRVHLFMGKDSKATWIDDRVCFKDFGYCINSIFDLVLEEGADLDHYALYNHCLEGFALEGLRGTLKKDSSFKSLSATLGGASVRQDYQLILQGKGASCELKGIGVLPKGRQAHNHILVHHKAPHTKSDQLFKQVIDQGAKGSFEGKIYVDPIAQKTQGYQLSKSLLLGETAISNSRPNLEIYADDVKASHGATITQIDPKELFYLQTRGIDPKRAKKLLLAGFATDLLLDIPYPFIRDKMKKMIDQVIG